uniref:Uncharacterized protein n=1 Tax=Setaria italica TaxID=4555 RepID=K4AIH5_SETIT
MWTHVETCVRTDPAREVVLSLNNIYALSLDLRLGYQTLRRSRVVIKVAFGFVKKHAMRHGQSRWDLPLSD